MMSTKVGKALAAAVFASGLAISPSASAATVDECQEDVVLVRGEITGATTFLNAKDQVGLTLKADSAWQKLDKGKFADAATILADMAAKVNTLVGAAKPKLDAAEAADMLAAIGVAQTCVQQLMTQ